MARINLQGALLQGNRHGPGEKWDGAHKVLSGNYTIPAEGPFVYFLDPGGTARSVTLPPEAPGIWHLVVNAGDENLLVRTDDGVLVMTVGEDQMGMVLCDGTNWYHALLSTTAGGGGGSVDLPFVTPSMFGAIGGDPETDDAPGLRAALAEDWVVFPANTTYYVNSEDGTTDRIFKITDRSIRIDGNGSKIVRQTPLVCLDISTTPLNETEVTAISTQSLDLSDGEAQTTWVSRLTVASTSGYQVGDLVKVVGEDLIPGMESNAQAGEFAWVASVDEGNSYIYLHSVLRGMGVYTPGTNSVRVARIRKDIDVDVSNLEFEDDPAGAASWNISCIWIKGLYQPRFAVKGRNIWGTFFADNSNYGLKAEIKVENADSAAGVRVSYGVLTQASEYGEVKVEASRCRHAFTTSPRAPGSDDYFFRRGWTYGYVVSGTAVACDAAGFDFHADAWDCRFVDCTATQSFRGNQGVGAGFQLDGRACEAIDCKSNGNRVGYQVFLRSTDTPATVGVGAGRDLRLVNCDCDDEEFGVIVTTSDAGDANKMDFKAEGGTWRTRRGTSVLTATRAECHVTDVKMVAPDRLVSAGTEVAIFELGVGANVYARGIEVDLRQSNGTAIRLAKVTGANASCNLHIERIFGVSGHLVAYLDCNSFTTANLKAKIHEADADPANISLDVGGGSVVQAELCKVGADIRGDEDLTLTGFMHNVQYFDTPLTADRTVTLPTSGNNAAWPRGKQYRFVRSMASAGVFHLNVGGLVEMEQGEWCDVMWSGAAWLLIAYGPLE